MLVQPGTDGAVASAVMHVLFRDGLADEAYMEKYTDNWRELREHLKDKTPLWAERISGVNARKIETLARAIGETERTYIRIGYGFARSRNGASQVHAVASIGTWLEENLRFWEAVRFGPIGLFIIGTRPL